jgi:hypothetical protein
MTWNHDWWKYIVSLDVESIGLHGPAISVGAVVFKNDEDVETFYGRVPDHELQEDLKMADPEDRVFVENHVLPHLGPETDASSRQMGDRFWAWWLKHKEAGATMVCDCPWPVEANFLSEVVRQGFGERKWEGPYPLVDVASFVVANGADPLEPSKRRSDELPVHHPVADARQSGRELLVLAPRQEEQDRQNIDDLIDRWHEGGTGMELHEFLGMSQDEYRAWVEQRSKQDE